MAGSFAGSTPSFSGADAHRLAVGELQCAPRASACSADSSRLLRADCSLSLERSAELSFCTSTARETRVCNWDELRSGKDVRRRCRSASRPIEAIAGDDAARCQSSATADRWLEAEGMWSKDSAHAGSKSSEGNQAWEILLHDLQFCDSKARKDVLAIKTMHDKVVDVLNPLAREWKSVHTLRKELADLQFQLAKAHDQVHLSESRVGRALEKLSEMESLVNNMFMHGPQQVTQSSTSQSHSAVAPKTALTKPVPSPIRSPGLVVAGPVKEFAQALKNFWYPVAFTDDISKDTMVPFECFEEPWVLFRGQDGKVGCVRNSCAHRACPLHLGEVKDGRIQCPYHGWEYATNGVCEKMPSTKPVRVSIQALPCVEHDGMVWIWPGGDVPDQKFPELSAPAGYTTHAQIIIELPVEHGLLMENLLDLAHAPFTHTSTFAKGWPVPSLVKFCTPVTALQGYWDPYPIDMEFQPPCMVRSTIGISKPGKLEGSSTQDCVKHLHQLHVCLPASRGKTRLLYRLSLDFLPILKRVPHIQSLWKYLANKVLDEDLRLVLGQQDRMIRGANVWNLPVSYDKLGVRYRRWRVSVEERDAMSEDNHTCTPASY